MSEFVKRVLAGIALVAILIVGASMCINEYNSYTAKVAEHESMTQQIVEACDSWDAANTTMAAKLDAYYAK